MRTTGIDIFAADSPVVLELGTPEPSSRGPRWVSATPRIVRGASGSQGRPEVSLRTAEALVRQRRAAATSFARCAKIYSWAQRFSMSLMARTDRAVHRYRRAGRGDDAGSADGLCGFRSDGAESARRKPGAAADIATISARRSPADRAGGGATGMIGDPRDAGERSLNTSDTVQEWAQRSGAVERFVDFDDSPTGAIVENNLNWTSGLGAIEFPGCRQAFSVNVMLDRDTIPGGSMARASRTRSSATCC